MDKTEEFRPSHGLRALRRLAERCTHRNGEDDEGVFVCAPWEVEDVMRDLDFDERLHQMLRRGLQGQLSDALEENREVWRLYREKAGEADDLRELLWEAENE